MAARPVFLLTDFGPAGPYQGVMRAVIARTAPAAPVHDLCHGVRQGDVREAAYVLEAAWPYLPDDAVVAAVVDPGVGSTRRILLLRSGLRLVLAPDNGLLTPLLEQEGPEVWSVEDTTWTLPERSATFHGRDVFAPLAGHLALGLDPDGTGPRVDDPVRLDVPAPRVSPRSAAGNVVHVDPFGNLVTDLGSGVLGDLPDGPRRVLFRDRTLDLVRTFSDVAPGAALAYVGSAGRLEIAVRDGSAARELGAGVGDPVVVEVR